MKLTIAIICLIVNLVNIFLPNALANVSNSKHKINESLKVLKHNNYSDSKTMENRKCWHLKGNLGVGCCNTSDNSNLHTCAHSLSWSRNSYDAKVSQSSELAKSINIRLPVDVTTY